MRHHRLEHQFVQYIPEQLSEGVLYISMEYGTAAHSCCCGCGEQVVTPFTPTDWKMIYDGESVSLWPSIGNWTLACRSHYMIDRGRVLEAGPWSDRQIAAERSRDHAAKARYYGAPASTESIAPPDDSPQLTAEGLLSRVRRWTRRSRR
jgi:hypothetical protein